MALYLTFDTPRTREYEVSNWAILSSEFGECLEKKFVILVWPKHGRVNEVGFVKNFRGNSIGYAWKKPNNVYSILLSTVAPYEP
jgi:hypothetical protein